MSVAVVQSAVSGDGYTCAFPSSVTAGNLLIVACGVYAGYTAATPTDTLGNAWNLGFYNSNYGGNGDSVWFFWAVAGSSGANTVTISGPGWPHSGSDVLIAEVSGMGSPTVDATGVGLVNQPYVNTPPALTLSSGSDVVFSFAFQSGITGNSVNVTAPETVIVHAGNQAAISWSINPPAGAFSTSLWISTYFTYDTVVISVALTAPVAVLAEGLVQCDGAVDGVSLLIGGSRIGAVQCSGSIGPIAFGSHASSVARCSGSALAALAALASSQGKTQCAGSVSGGITFYAVVQGKVQCQGFATAPLKGTSTSCLQPSSTPVVPVQGNACY